MHKLFFSNLLPGTLLFSRFVLERCLGATHDGGVYLCRDTRAQGKFRAIKILSTRVGEESEICARLLREVNFSQRIQHPNVLRGDEIFRDEDFIAFTMEFVDGGSLADYLEERVSFELMKSIHILSQLCDALGAIHSAGILHRDLKPENVLIASNQTLKVTDFGISSAIDADLAQNRDNITGSLNYLSPEYISNGAYDIRSDIYAIGVIAYEIATGKLPFKGNSLLETLMMRVKFDPTPPHVAAQVPRPLSLAIMKAISREPEKRFQTIDEIREAFDFIRLPHGLPCWAL